MAIQALTSLAFSMHSNPGVYALLVGSGVSRSAGIPTGYEVLSDLVTKIAKINNSDTGSDPYGWFRATYSEDASYSRVLEQLSHSPAERSRLLRTYFEPSEDDRRDGLKMPTAAHRAIAQLIKNKLVKVVVTTNFDRLLEHALEAEGIVPVVVSSEDSARGATPLVHNQCTIIKVHGDYLDPEIRNTEQELSSYGPHLTGRLSEVFDEYGLVVCGWSAEWDAGLVAALKAAESRRFSNYWCSRGEVTLAARDLITFRKAVSLHIADSDQFFSELLEKTLTLKELSDPDPLSIPIAVATIKRYLPDPSQRIKLNDFVDREVKRAKAEIRKLDLPILAEVTAENMEKRLTLYENSTELLRHLVAVGAFWGSSQSGLWAIAVTSLSQQNPIQGAYRETWVRLALYPSMLVFYTAGIGALAARNYEALHQLLSVKVEMAWKNKKFVSTRVLNAATVVDANSARKIPSLLGFHTPGSDRAFETIRSSLYEVVQEEEYERLFDEFEFLLCLSHADSTKKESNNIYAPWGRFAWKNSWDEEGVLKRVPQELEEAKENWPIVKGGFFGGDYQRAKQVMDEYIKYLNANARFF